jgi:hypothetical protein
MENWGRMKLLIDTNIFLEVILGQEKAEKAKKLLSKSEDKGDEDKGDAHGLQI